MDISNCRVPCAIEKAYYIPEFISREEEEYLQRKVADSSIVKWKTLPNRRLQVWGGEVTSSNALIPQELPKFITDYPDIIPRLRGTGIFSSSKHGEPNHVIVNEYQPGQGIMPHEDGPNYHPVVATLSLGSHAVFHYHQYLQEHVGDSTLASATSAGRAIDPTPVLSLLLEPRSLVITAKSLYTDHLHAIEPLERDILAPCQPNRVSMTGRRDLNQHGLHSGPDWDCSDQRDSNNGVKAANWEMLRGERESQAAREGGVLERGTRISLTCRAIERVAGGRALGKVFARW